MLNRYRPPVVVKKMKKQKTSKKYHPLFQEWIDIVEGEVHPVCKEQKQLVQMVKKMLDSDEYYFDEQKAVDSVEKPKPYFPFELFPHQKFINACTFGLRNTEDGSLVFDTILELVGRGAGKTGKAAYNSFFMLSGHHGVKNYDIDTVGTSEDQAKKTFSDVYKAIDEDESGKLKRVFKYNLTAIEHKGTGSVMVYNTSNARTKDGKRTGAVIFDEFHEYSDYANINVFTTGQGKVDDGRVFITTTDGNVRGGPLDDYKEEAAMVLSGEVSAKESGLFPFICKLDDESEVDDERMWVKANPSLPYMPSLMKKMRREYQKMQRNKDLFFVFMTKRMNLPRTDVRREVASYESRLATDQPLPDLEIRRDAIGGLDFSDTRDFTSVGILFKDEKKTYWLQHTFIHEIALQTQNIKREIIELAESKGLCTIVRNTPSIGHERVVNWYLEQAKRFNIKKIALDTYRSTVVGPALKEAGFEIDIVRRGPATHAMLAPLIDDLFINENIVFHDDPLMRWYVGNVYVDEKGNGNKEYLKIDKDTRKTDGFFAFTHALNFETELKRPKKLRVYKSINM